VQRLACLIVETHVYSTSAISKVGHPLIGPSLDNPNAVEHAEKPKGGGVVISTRRSTFRRSWGAELLNQSDSATSS
jgi:hypothetical protein